MCYINLILTYLLTYTLMMDGREAIAAIRPPYDHPSINDATGLLHRDLNK